MLQLKNIIKTYHTGDLKQDALKGISLNFRDNEFVSILGQSGSGKTTLLNIIGGLDKYTDGDLVINGVSTKEYGDKDWDAYRNHTIGFIFQSYNLIPHQSVLANVEMALTLAGVSKKERRERAVEVLNKVGLEQHIHKKPNQMSGGQMQRVAIARALINDPDILLADEPTGALDTETSIQIMELLKEIADDKLVIMVTHNPELAEQYSTRIVKLSDGCIISDSAPCEEREEKKKEEKKSKISMSFLTALSLSFNNLRTKKGRTLLTAMAGSIGIVGIGLILSVSTGMNDYINSIQKDTMSQYPISIGTEAIDTGAIYGRAPEEGESAPEEETTSPPRTGIYSDYRELYTTNIINNVIKKNDLGALKKYLDNPDSEINKFVGEKGIVYGYDIKFSIFTHNTEGKLIDTDEKPEAEDTSSSDGGFLSNLLSGGFSIFGSDSSSTADNFNSFPKGENGEIISDAIKENYELLYGEWPDDITETLAVISRDNTVTFEEMYSLGLITNEQYNEIARKIKNGEDAPPVILDYETLTGKEFYLVTPAARYTENENGTFSYIEELEGNEDKILNEAIKLTVSGVIKRKDGAEGASVSGPVAYSEQLKDFIISVSAFSPVTAAQLSSPDINVLTGMKFEIGDDNEKLDAVKKYLKGLPEGEKASLYKMISLTGLGSSKNPEEEGTVEAQPETKPAETTSAPEATLPDSSQQNKNPDSGLGFLGDLIFGFFGNIKASFENIAKLFDMLKAFNELSQKYPDFSPEKIGELLENFSQIQSDNIENILGNVDIEELIKDFIGSDNGFSSDGDSYFAAEFDKWLAASPDEAMLLTVFDGYASQTSYEDNLNSFGYIDIEKPSSVNIYADNFENKDALAECIKSYNSTVPEEQQIAYTDYAAMLTSSLTSIINGISYVLVAFVAISLFVSGIMIGIITHISVMERTKEIGILRALGASKINIAQVFNAETFIIGWCSGLLGVIVTLIGIIPINAVIEMKTGIENLDAALPFTSAAALIMISIVITLIGGLIPAYGAARKDPVAALRTE